MARPKGSKNKPKLEGVQGSQYWIERPEDDPYRDWLTDSPDWITEYVNSKDHPHRQLIVDALEKFYPFGGILEIGCNAGPNLTRIQDKYPETQLAGIDLNGAAIERAKSYLPKPILKVGSVLNIPFHDKEFDVVISDAVLLYIEPKEIDHAFNEIDRVAKRGIILVERFDDSLTGEITGHVWGRNYTKILQNMGFAVIETRITEKEWGSSHNWVKHGRVFIGYRVQ